MILEKKLIQPLITEKGMKLEAENKYVFEVAMDATKGAIAKELKDSFGVDVINVNTSILPGKKRRILKTPRFKKTSKRKKAVVELKKGQKLDIFPKETK